MTERADLSATDIAIIGMALRVPGANTVERPLERSPSESYTSHKAAFQKSESWPTQVCWMARRAELVLPYGDRSREVLSKARPGRPSDHFGESIAR
jgi:hypothetical protein